MRTIQEAISISEQEQRTTELIVNSISEVAEVAAMMDYYYDYCEYEPGHYDVWGWVDNTPDHETEWRLDVTLNPTVGGTR